MEIENVINALEQNQLRLSAHLPESRRGAFSGLSLARYRGALVVGPRGTGKTTLLLSEAKCHQHTLYVSADHPLVSRYSLWDLAEQAFMQGYEVLAVDEVHFAQNWSQHLKAIYDSFPDKRIWASDSSSLVLRAGLVDLSRRFPRVEVPFLSFREYLHLADGQIFPLFDALCDDIEHDVIEGILKSTNLLARFREYLAVGFRPIFLEGDYHSRILNIIEKIIFSDIPFLLPQLKERYLRLMNAVIGYLATSSVPTLNVESLCNEWGVGKDKLYEVLAALEHVQLLNIVRLPSDHKARSKGAKLLLADPTMYAALGGPTGNAREAFVVTALRSAGKQVFAAKRERDADFVVDGVTIEVGGRHKKRKQADKVVRDETEFPTKNSVPLWCLGFLW